MTDLFNNYGEIRTIEVPWFSKVQIALHTNGLSIAFRAWEQDQNFDQDEPFDIEGFLKWDGCLEFRPHPNCYYHFCEPDSLMNLLNLFNRIGDEANATIPGYHGKFRSIQPQ